MRVLKKLTNHLFRRQSPIEREALPPPPPQDSGHFEEFSSAIEGGDDNDAEDESPAIIVDRPTPSRVSYKDQTRPAAMVPLVPAIGIPIESASSVAPPTPCFGCSQSNPSPVLTGGTHKGKTYDFVLQNYTGYVWWAIREGNPREDFLRKFKQWLLQNGDVPGTIGSKVTIGFGKHKGKRFIDVYETDPDYCSWALGVESPGDELAKFVFWLKLIETSCLE